MSTDTTTRAAAEAAFVRGGFEAVGRGDLAAFAAVFHEDATWNHRNPDTLGGVHAGVEAIVEFLGASMEMTAGTLAPVPQLFLGDGEGHVAVLTSISGSRPDGRTFADTQILYFTLEDGLARSVDQFIGDPPAVTAFWA